MRSKMSLREDEDEKKEERERKKRVQDDQKSENIGEAER